MIEEDMAVEDMIKMGNKLCGNNKCCRRMVLGRRLDQPFS